MHAFHVAGVFALYNAFSFVGKPFRPLLLYTFCTTFSEIPRPCHHESPRHPQDGSSGFRRERETTKGNRIQTKKSMTIKEPIEGAAL